MANGNNKPKTQKVLKVTVEPQTAANPTVARAKKKRAPQKNNNSKSTATPNAIDEGSVPKDGTPAPYQTVPTTEIQGNRGAVTRVLHMNAVSAATEGMLEALKVNCSIPKVPLLVNIFTDTWKACMEDIRDNALLGRPSYFKEAPNAHAELFHKITGSHSTGVLANGQTTVFTFIGKDEVLSDLPQANWSIPSAVLDGPTGMKTIPANAVSPTLEEQVQNAKILFATAKAAGAKIVDMTVAPAHCNGVAQYAYREEITGTAVNATHNQMAKLYHIVPITDMVTAGLGLSGPPPPDYVADLVFSEIRYIKVSKRVCAGYIASRPDRRNSDELMHVVYNFKDVNSALIGIQNGIAQVFSDKLADTTTPNYMKLSQDAGFMELVSLIAMVNAMVPYSPLIAGVESAFGCSYATGTQTVLKDSTASATVQWYTYFVEFYRRVAMTVNYRGRRNQIIREIMIPVFGIAPADVLPNELIAASPGVAWTNNSIPGFEYAKISNGANLHLGMPSGAGGGSLFFQFLQAFGQGRTNFANIISVAPINFQKERGFTFSNFFRVVYKPTSLLSALDIFAQNQDGPAAKEARIRASVVRERMGIKGDVKLAANDLVGVEIVHAATVTTRHMTNYIKPFLQMPLPLLVVPVIPEYGAGASGVETAMAFMGANFATNNEDETSIHYLIISASILFAKSSTKDDAISELEKILQNRANLGMGGALSALGDWMSDTIPALGKHKKLVGGIANVLSAASGLVPGARMLGL